MVTTLRATEAAYTRTVIAAASILGYRVNHNRPALTAKGWRTPISGHAGAPDLLIAGHGRVLHVELKRHGNRLTPEQVAWQTALVDAGADHRVLVVPDQLDTFIAELTERART